MKIEKKLEFEAKSVQNESLLIPTVLETIILIVLINFPEYFSGEFMGNFIKIQIFIVI